MVLSRQAKIIPDAVELMKHPIGLAMLLCDDGSVLKRKKIYPDGSIHYLKPALTIATHSFSRENVEKLLKHIRELCHASGYINPERRIRQGKLVEYNRTRFNIAEGKKLWGFVVHEIPTIPSMNKKFAYMYETYSPHDLA